MTTQESKEPDLEPPLTAEDIPPSSGHQTLLESCCQPTTGYVQRKY
jgi:hypothetical protein